jgi:hypothetical protein
MRIQTPPQWGALVFLGTCCLVLNQFEFTVPVLVFFMVKFVCDYVVEFDIATASCCCPCCSSCCFYSSSGVPSLSDAVASDTAVAAALCASWSSEFRFIYPRAFYSDPLC